MARSRRSFMRRSLTGAAALWGGWSGYPARGLAAPAGTNWPDNPYLQGNFAPVQEEIFVERLPVVGRVPDELRGMFVRNGPNPHFPPTGNYHWFDGDGMLHGVHLTDGQASYRNRWVRTAGWQRELAAGKSLWGGLADPPELAKIMAGDLPFKNAANTALVWHDGRLLALWEAGPPHAVHLPDLETVGPATYAGQLKHPFTAHPKVDPATGEMLFFGYSPLSPLVHFSVASAAGQLQRTTAVRVPRPVMMHDFAITRRFAIFLDLPATFNLARVGRGEPMLKFEPDLGARFGLLPRDGSTTEVKWFSGAPCFMFHTLNAWEEGEEVVLLGCRMEKYPDVLGTGASNGRTVEDLSPAEASRLYRWRFNVATGAVREEPLDDRGCEFPRINDQLLGAAARWGYAMPLDTGGLVRYDLQTGTRAEHRYGPGRHGGEGVFVPRPSSQAANSQSAVKPAADQPTESRQAEDHGWLLNYVFDEAQGKSELVIVDARDFTGPPVARVLLPCRVPYGFHGAWVSEEQLARQQPLA